ncbi:MAG: type II toxin-antitoxin system RelE/ParE family toxin, partial [Pirellulales bacterium]
MAQYRLAELARHDLVEIHRYIASDSASAADRLLTTFFQTFGALATHPELGTARPEYKGGNLRSFSV